MAYNFNQISAVLALFSEMEKSMPVTYARVLMECAIWKLSCGDWPSMKTIEERCGMSQSAFSRAVGALSDRRQNEKKNRPGNQPPLGLLERFPDPSDKRAMRLRITDKGQEFLESLSNLSKDSVKPVTVKAAA